MFVSVTHMASVGRGEGNQEIGRDGERMYEIGDTVLYDTQGVCRIAQITEKDFNGKRLSYYVLKPVYDEKSTVFVPVDNESLTQRMRRILSEEEIHALIRSMPQEDAHWIEDENERKQAYKEVLAQGDRVKLIQTIKALYLHREKLRTQGKKLHVADERFFKEAEKLLYDEFAHVLHIAREEILPYILAQCEAMEGE